MCMIADAGSPAWSDGDTICWKLVEYVLDKNGKQVAFTPYRFTRIPDEILRGESDMKAAGEDKYEDLRKYQEWPIVSGGYIHTYAELDPKQIVEDVAYLRSAIGRREDYMTPCMVKDMPDVDEYPTVSAFALFRCVIPGRTMMFKGRADCPNETPNYASKRVRFVERVGYWDTRCPDTGCEMFASKVRDICEKESAIAARSASAAAEQE